MQYPKQHYNQFHDDLEFQILEREPQAKKPIIIRNQASLNIIEQQQQENFYNQNHIEKIDISHNNGIQLELQKIKIEKHMQIQKLASFQEEDDKQYIQKSDTCNYFLLGFLYLYQGLIIGFIEGSIPIILIQSGASFAQLGILSFTGYPWSFQMLSAPIFDTYYSRSFGKRKTYLIPLQLTSSIILIATSFYINNLIETQNIGLLFIIGVSLEYIYSVQDITVGGWALTLLKPENVHMASSCQQIGQTLGSTLAYTGYIWLNSPQKLNQYLGTDIQEPILDPQRFFTISSVLIFIGTFYVMFFKKEEMAEDHCKNYEKEKQNRKGLFDNLRKLKGFYTNPNLRILIFYRLIMPLSTAPIDNLSDLILLKKGKL
ncbi:Major facilitator superfamily domain, general substrate transporter [Pseudocohnilembus persalinus]|uniref:Major facilitator superfamily domain, general substrate transporter n=1 Tax=Pseudocohnilembus persalinus TaxID=266149 RepID=A0A0V0QRC8_PSEPJ|nr:Major facilitator superfamily domain, general substrate transporter [Pseudocohnilembus persalinus]|eukprot:KRX04554.1 Major facilitator superfamily domain, general substrate transporter [Pseudocohnilembus persalinus]